MVGKYMETRLRFSSSVGNFNFLLLFLLLLFTVFRAFVPNIAIQENINCFAHTTSGDCDFPSDI